MEPGAARHPGSCARSSAAGGGEWAAVNFQRSNTSFHAAHGEEEVTGSRDGILGNTCHLGASQGHYSSCHTPHRLRCRQRLRINSHRRRGGWCDYLGGYGSWCDYLGGYAQARGSAQGIASDTCRGDLL